ncbi:MAG: U32 family peptidase [Prevotellaceae bacterium]|nr:U32 family peptidase [Prevotellaceae bacterium]
MSTKRKIELLAPARDAACGREAILHGADAVYIGGPAFGARAAVGNATADIAELCRFAHLYGAKIYVALNTILYDNELADAERIVHELYAAGVDALIVQDMALLQMNLPPIALHASTQTDIRTPEKARWLEAAGFSQLVLARELSLSEIRAIGEAVSVSLEAFVHGALCVSLSGRCYASEYLFGRSANRGRCAQFCRLAFDLIDAGGETLLHNRHLLSLRDMNRSHSVGDMIDAGVSSFKIEGRLKDAAYVKNITAHYRRLLDAAIAERAETCERASFGRSIIGFEPAPEKSFNRGFTEYFLHGRGREAFWSFETPKSRGEYAGKIVKTGRRSLTVETEKTIAAGDGLCFAGTDGTFEGFRVNRVQQSETGAAQQEIFPASMPRIVPGTALYRNFDQVFEKSLSRSTARRTLSTDLTLSAATEGFVITARAETGATIAYRFACPHETAARPQRETQMRTLAKLGDTPFEAREIRIDLAEDFFIPASLLTTARRTATDALQEEIRRSHVRETRADARPVPEDCGACLAGDYRENVSNRLAAAFYAKRGAHIAAPAFERRRPTGEVVLMECKHCLRLALGACPRHCATGGRTLHESLALRLPGGRQFALKFDCKNCRMLVLPDVQPREHS